MLDTLTSIVSPVEDKLVSSYYIVVGEHGTGYDLIDGLQKNR